jgi:hypothetical protein
VELRIRIHFKRDKFCDYAKILYLLFLYPVLPPRLKQPLNITGVSPAASAMPDVGSTSRALFPPNIFRQPQDVTSIQARPMV